MMPSRRQSMRFSSLKSSTITVTKTSVSNVVSSTPFSPKRGRDMLALESFSDISSPKWISGSEIDFKTPKSPPMSRRSTIHHSTKNRNDMDFKIPSLMFSSPPGIKTRSRRSSIYESSQQKNTRVQKQQGKAAVRRVGKKTGGKITETHISPAKIVFTDVSLVSSPVSKTKKITKRTSGKVLKTLVKPRRAKNASLSPSKSKSSNISGRLPSTKPSPRSTSKRRETRSLVSAMSENVTSPAAITLIKQKAGKKVSSAEHKKTVSPAETFPKGKTTTPVKTKATSPTVKSPSSKKVESTERKSARQARGVRLSPQGKQALSEKLTKLTASVNASVSESPKRTLSQRVKKATRATKKKDDSSGSPAKSPRLTKSTSMRRSRSPRLEVSLEKSPRLDFVDQKQELKQNTSSKKSLASTPESSKRSSSQRVKKSSRATKKKGDSSGSPAKSPRQTKSTSKRSRSSRLEVSLEKLVLLDFGEQKQESSSKAKQKTPAKKSLVHTPESLKRSPSPRIKKATQSTKKKEDSSGSPAKSPRPTKSTPKRRSRSSNRKVSLENSVPLDFEEQKQDSPSGKQRIHTKKKSLAHTPESPKRSPLQRVKKSSRSTVKRGDSSGSPAKSPKQTKSTPKRRSRSSRLEVSLEKLALLDFGEQKQESPSKAKQKIPAKKSPKSKKNHSAKSVSDPKSRKSTPSLQRVVSPLTKQTPQNSKLPKAGKKSQSAKRTPNLQNRSSTLLSEKEGSSSKLSKKSMASTSAADTPRNKKALVLKKSPSLRNKKTPPSQRKESPTKRQQKSLSIKSPQTKRLSITRRTPNRRESIRELSSHQKQASSSTKAKVSPVGKSSLVKRADITLKNASDQVVTSRSSRVVNLGENLRTFDGKTKDMPSLSKNFKATEQNKNNSVISPLPTGLFYRAKAYPSKVAESSGMKWKSPLPPLMLQDLKSISESRKEKVEISRSQISSRWNEKYYATSPTVTSLTSTSQDISSPISSRDSLSSARRSKRSFIASERPTSSANFMKTLVGDSQETSSDSLKPLSHSPEKKRRLETEIEEIDRMVDTMVQASSYQKRRSPSPSAKISKASPARVTIVKEIEAQALLTTAVPLSGRKSLHVYQNITPSTAAPKARKILGVFDSPSTKTETSQSYKSEQRSESSSFHLRQYDGRQTEKYNEGLDLQRDDDGKEKEEEGEGSEQFAEESGSEEKEEISVQEDETTTDSDSETDMDDMSDENITWSHTSQSQRCTIS